MTTVERQYHITFVLDLREREETPEAVLDYLAELATSLGAKVQDKQNLGLHTFARQPRREFAQGVYVRLVLEAPTKMPAELKHKLRLDKRIDRLLVEAQD